MLVSTSRAGREGGPVPGFGRARTHRGRGRTPPSGVGCSRGVLTKSQAAAAPVGLYTLSRFPAGPAAVLRYRGRDDIQDDIRGPKRGRRATARQSRGASTIPRHFGVPTHSGVPPFPVLPLGSGRHTARTACHV
ncbi:hypothetical protein GCM10010376_41870 [Streptomyces violaceusniger]